MPCIGLHCLHWALVQQYKLHIRLHYKIYILYKLNLSRGIKIMNILVHWFGEKTLYNWEI